MHTGALHHSDFHQSFGTLSVAESAQVLFFVRKELFHELWVIPAVLSESPSDGLPDKELLFVHSQSTKLQQHRFVGLVTVHELGQNGGSPYPHAVLILYPTTEYWFRFVAVGRRQIVDRAVVPGHPDALRTQPAPGEGLLREAEAFYDALPPELMTR